MESPAATSTSTATATAPTATAIALEIARTATAPTATGTGPMAPRAHPRPGRASAPGARGGRGAGAPLRDCVAPGEWGAAIVGLLWRLGIYASRYLARCARCVRAPTLRRVMRHQPGAPVGHTCAGDACRVPAAAQAGFASKPAHLPQTSAAHLYGETAPTFLIAGAGGGRWKSGVGPPQENSLKKLIPDNWGGVRLNMCAGTAARLRRHWSRASAWHRPPRAPAPPQPLPTTGCACSHGCIGT